MRTKRLVVRVRVPIELASASGTELRQRPLLSWSVQQNTPRQSELDKPTTKHRNETDYSLQQQFEHVERLFLIFYESAFPRLAALLSFRLLQLPVA